MSGSDTTLVPDWLSVPADPAALDPSIWTPSFQRDASGEMTVDGHPVTDLVRDFGTPAYVYSEDTFRSRAREYRAAFEEAFAQKGAEVSVYYAGKAFLCASVARWARDEGLNLDTASGGELALGLAAGMPAGRIALHGNNKSVDEIRRALSAGVGRIVADSVPELFLIDRQARELGVTAPVMIRVTPGVHAETHDFIATAHEDQKFGVSLAEGTAALVREVIGEGLWSALGLSPSNSAALLAGLVADSLDNVDLRGFHSHIGSQIFSADGFGLAAERVLGLMAEVSRRIERDIPELDIGGGYGIGYIAGDRPRRPADIAGDLAAVVTSTCTSMGISIPHVSIEPGRALTGPAGATLYTVGTLKDVAVDTEPGGPQVRRYVSVDGGMSDNARPVLYDADYTVTLANRTPEGTQVLSRVVGKHCESGDIVVRYCYLPADLRSGDVLAVAATGAYCWALSSNYNYLPRPGVVATSSGVAPRTIVRGETEDDLFARDAGL
ncbi:diaminopimelate decarboxylase family protein [Kocuria massiliensis]|uniref:diaminopimelate decarboxylase family protein n=1 Tax=Kocuria massiliensis TaxID=1926282 RepID=UPI0022B99FC9|nr:diaminopimelate decarboxylase [Kocuria massiliensis]